MSEFKATTILCALFAVLLSHPGNGVSQTASAPPTWKRNDPTRPHPPFLAPPEATAPAPRPSDAIVLFDGVDLSAWVTGPDAQPPRWKVENGYVEVVPGSGSIRTREDFGDLQLHVEWSVPNPPIGSGDSGDSGVMLMGNYEIQIVDSYRRATSAADGIAASIYGLHPPLVSAVRPPGEWQTYDIFFRRPRFGPDGRVTEAARVTVVHNGVLVQNNEIIPGPTIPGRPAVHPALLPLTLQGNTHPVRFRNVWVRKIPDRPEPARAYSLPGSE
jgi:hypothetical protein